MITAVTQFVLVALLAGLCACASAPRVAPEPPPASAAPATALLPVAPAGGKVTRVNAEMQFCVVDFTGRAWPGIGARLGVYRDGAKVGEVILTEPSRGRLVTADIVQGEARVGDEVR